MYLPYLCMNVELNWIAHSWKQSLFFLMKPTITTHYETSEFIGLTDCDTLSFEYFYCAIKVLSF